MGEKYYEDDWVQIHCSHVLDALKGLPSESVQLVMTSPPYWGLRNYSGGEDIVWGSDPECEHQWVTNKHMHNWERNQSPKLGISKDASASATGYQYTNFCSLCGSWKGQLGLEPTWQLFVQHLVEISREIKRVLKREGSFFLVLGSTYSGGIGSNRLNLLSQIIEKGVFLFGNSFSIRVAPKGSDIKLNNSLSPDGINLCLFGSQRVSIKKGDDNLCQVFLGLNTICNCRVPIATRIERPNETHTEIILNDANDVSIIISKDDLEKRCVIGARSFIDMPISNEEAKMPLTINKSREPITEIIGNNKPIWDAFSLNSFPKGIPYIYLVDNPVSFSDTFVPTSSQFNDFSISISKGKQFNLFSRNLRVNYSFSSVAHGWTPSNWFTPLSLLYDKAIKKSNIDKPKQNLLIPERVAMALQEDGFILRDSITWAKPNAMPSSVKDRLTITTERIFRFIKNDKTILWRNRQTGEWRDTRPTKEENYPYGSHDQDGNKLQPLWMGFDHYFDLDAIRVPHSSSTIKRVSQSTVFDQLGGLKQDILRGNPESGNASRCNRMVQSVAFNLRVRDVKRGKGGAYVEGGQVRQLSASEEEVERYQYPETKYAGTKLNPESRRRTLQEERDYSRVLAPRLFPEDERAQQDFINEVHDKGLSGVMKGKAPSDVIEVEGREHRRKPDGHYARDHLTQPPEPEVEPGRAFHQNGKNPGDHWSITTSPFPQAHFAVYPERLCVMPILACSRPGDVVLDPFAGSGTTGVVAKKLGRKAILVDCVGEYCEIAKGRIEKARANELLEAMSQMEMEL